MRAIAFALFLAVARHCFGAVYFVDYSTGSDANAGTSTGAPWQHAPGDDRATGNAAITLSPGDTVVWKGGVTYPMTALDSFQLNSSGVTLISGHRYSPAWGSGRAFIDMSLSAPTNDAIDGCWYLGSRSNANLRGFYFSGGGYQDSYSAMVAWRGTSGTDAYLYVDDCIFSNHVESAIYIVGDYDSGDFSKHFTVTNSGFFNIGTHGVFLRYGLTNCQVINCTFDTIGTRTNSPGPGGDPVAVFGHDSPSWNAGLIVRGNDMANVPIKSAVILSDQHSGALIERNYIHGTNGYSGIDLNGSGTNLTIRNNLFFLRVANFYGPIAVDTDQGSGILLDGLALHNNTIWAYTPNIGLLFLGKGNSGSAQTSRNVDIRNNILIGQTASRAMIYIETSATGAPATELATFQSDYNTFETNGYSTAFHLQGTNFSFAAWQSLGYDAQSHGGTPSFSAGFDLDAGDTLALNKGVTISTVTTDRLGTVRPQGSAYDIGAFEFIESVVGPGRLLMRGMMQAVGNVFIGTIQPEVTSYLIKQDFEGTGFDNSETWVKVGSQQDEDYADNPLVGSQSFYSLNNTTATNETLSPIYTVTASQNHYGYCQIKILAFPTSSNYRILNISNVLDVAINSTSNLVVRPAVGTGVATVGKLETNTVYHVWFTGTFSTDTATVGFSTDGVRPTAGDNFATDTDVSASMIGTSRLILGSRQIGANYAVVFDKVRINDSLIGDNPQ